MATKWVTSDWHFGHRNIIKFTNPHDGTPIRPIPGTTEPFESIEQHDELYIEKHNRVVKPQDKVYCLGDVGNLKSVARLNGRKTLILGNHDDHHNIRELADHFVEILSWKVWGKDFETPFVMCHYPLHPTSDFPVARRICVHGHIHEKRVLTKMGNIDPWYENVCVEHTLHAPLHWDELQSRLKNAKKRTEAGVP